MNTITVRKAVDADVSAITDLLNYYAKQQVVLARTPEDIRHYLDNFLIASADGKVVGCVAIRDFGSHLYEVRSLAILPEYQSRSAGRQLVTEALDGLRESEKDNGFRLFALTYVPGFFEKLGFIKVGKELFPEKIWCDCNNCPKRDRCDEIAMLYSWPNE